MRFLWIILVLCVVANSSCGKQETQPAKKSTDSNTSESSVVEKSSEPDVAVSEKKPEEPSFKPFFVYKDKGFRQNHYTPSGFMPNGNCIKFDAAWKDKCQDGTTCIRVAYDIECSKKDSRWAGVYWLNPANNWGRRNKGGYNLTGAQKLVFWAKGEVGGEQIQEFTVGGIDGDFPDSEKVVMGPVILSNEWKEYSIDLRGKDLSYISGGFAWSTEVDVNPESCVFYLDNIRYE